MGSIHRQLVRTLTLALATVLAIGGIVTHAIVGLVLERELDRVLLRDVHNVTPQLVFELWRKQTRGSVPGSVVVDPGLLRGVWLQAWDANGAVVFRSRHLGDRTLPRFAAHLEPVSLTDESDVTKVRYHDVRLAGTVPLRAVAARFSVPQLLGFRFAPDSSPDESVIEVVLAQDRDAVEHPLATLRWLILAISLGCLGVTAWAAARAVRRGLRPLVDLQEEIDGIDHERLDHVIHLDGAPAELAPVRDELNALMVRLSDAFRREQQFAASAAHELRTPLAGLRATIEVSLQADSRPAGEYRADLERSYRLCVSMQDIVETLLDLVRETSHRPASVVRVGEFLARRKAAVNGGNRIRTELGATDADLEITVREDLLERVVDNVFDNALEHGTPEGEVFVRVAHSGDGVAIEVRNPVGDVPDDLESMAFQPFWRAETARADRRHVGLGLGLCRTLVQRLGGSITIRRIESSEVLVRIELPGS